MTTRDLRCRALQCPPLYTLDPNAATYILPGRGPAPDFAPNEWDLQGAYDLGGSSRVLDNEQVRVYRQGDVLELGDVIFVKCQRGFRFNSSLPSAPYTYSMPCQTGCQSIRGPEAQAPACTPVLCPSVSLPANAHLLDESLDSLLGMAHAATRTVACGLGYKVKGTACQTQFQVQCDDGALVGMRECVTIQCGCGSGSCPPLTTSRLLDFDPYASSQLQRWDSSSAVPHGNSITLWCAEGFRASTTRVAACTDSVTYEVDCNDCTLASRNAVACAPVSCGRFEDYRYLYDAETMASVVYAPVYGDKAYQTVATVTCQKGYRARLYGAIDEPKATDPESFHSNCTANCAWSPWYECVLLGCGDFSPVHGRIIAKNGQPMDGISTVKLQHGDEVHVACNSGYKQSSSGGTGGNCSLTFIAQCQSGTVVSISSATSRDGEDQEVHERASSCVPIDCARGDRCGEGSGGICSLSNLSQVDPLALLPQSYLGGQLIVQCRAGAGAVVVNSASNDDSFALCGDPGSYTYRCTDCRWEATEGHVCKPRVCDAIDTTNVANIYDGSVMVPSREWPHRGIVGRTLTITCELGTRASKFATADIVSPQSFAITCETDCHYAGMQACRPLTCGRFLSEISFILDSHWSFDRIYYHGEEVHVQCRPSYVVAGVSCAKEFTVRCWDGVFESSTQTSNGALPQCEPVQCKDESGTKRTCGEGFCPAFIDAGLEDYLSQVDLVTDEALGNQSLYVL